MAEENQDIRSLETRRKYVEAWNTTMVKIWTERIMQYGVFENPRRESRAGDPHLLDSVRYFPVKHDDKYMELTMHFTFPEYGIFQDRGTGREKPLGNEGDIGDYTEAGFHRKYRKPRPWFSIKWYASCMNMKEFMVKSIQDNFVGIMTTTFKDLETGKG